MIRPGPASIEPGAAPGGVVIHVYAVPSARLLIESHATTLADAAYRAGLDADDVTAQLRADDAGVCLVAYDGDTGARYTAEQWTAAP
jgi:hypothetical protein